MKLATLNPFAKTTKNNAGGAAFRVDPFVRLNRFLMLGSEGGTYYVAPRKLTLENAENLRACLALDGLRTVREIVETSETGRAPRQDPAVFALAVAVCQGDERTRAEALAALPRVCRTATHLFGFLAIVNEGRGWGRALRRAVGEWYVSKDAGKLELQLTKYANRGGWTHRDALRLSHPKPGSPEQSALFAWASGKGAAPSGGLAEAAARLKTETDGAKAAAIIREARLPREAVPTQLLTDPFVWEALLADMPMTATIRNLATMTRVGLLTSGTPEVRTVVGRLTDPARLKGARIHPVALLLALRTYAAGWGDRGRNVWNPAPEIVAALDEAFHLSFGMLETNGKRTVIGLDVSGSMTGSVAGMTMSCAEGAAAMAMALVAMGSDVRTMAFAESFKPLPFHKGLRLDAALALTRGMTFGRTDCAQPMLWAKKHKVEADTFVVLTDNETWYGSTTPMQALRDYRAETGIDASLVVVAMTATEFSIADPNDPKTLDVAGFDATVPQIVASV